MKANRTPWFVWLPRVLTILFIAFISLFALDVFQPGKTWQASAIDFLIHLIPSFLLLFLLFLFWNKEWILGIAFILLGITYVFMAYHHLDWILIISGPLFLAGAFFLISWFLRSHHV